MHKYKIRQKLKYAVHKDILTSVGNTSSGFHVEFPFLFYKKENKNQVYYYLVSWWLGIKEAHSQNPVLFG